MLAIMLTKLSVYVFELIDFLKHFLKLFEALYKKFYANVSLSSGLKIDTCDKQTKNWVYLGKILSAFGTKMNW